jgi:hypothetical protein
MKLKHIKEGFLALKMREALRDGDTSGIMPTNQLPTAATGFDAGNRTAGDSSYTTGVPRKPRHRKFFGMPVEPKSPV